MSSAALLDCEGVKAYVRSRGLLEGHSPVSAEVLSGGVSSVVLRVSQRKRHLIVKQARAQLQVREPWFASQDRSEVEGDALSLIADITPHRAPRVIDRDSSMHVLVLECAPTSWRDWRALIFDGVVDTSLGQKLGCLLACWQENTTDAELLPTSFSNYEHWNALRIDPFYRTVAARQTSIKAEVEALVAHMEQRRLCLVHGDFSPKNVLVGGDGFWVVDFEVAHFGDPVFDVAFLVCHLLLKSVHVHSRRAELTSCLIQFLKSYTDTATSDPLGLEPNYLFMHVGCLLLARVIGKSPAGYLSPAERDQIEAFGTRLIVSPPTQLEGLLRMRDAICA